MKPFMQPMRLLSSELTHLPPASGCWRHLPLASPIFASPTTNALQSGQRDHTPTLAVLSSSHILVPGCPGKLFPGPQHMQKPNDVFHITYVQPQMHIKTASRSLRILGLKWELCKRLLPCVLEKWWWQETSKPFQYSFTSFQICPTCIWLNLDMGPTVTADQLPTQLMWQRLHSEWLYQ